MASARAELENNLEAVDLFGAALGRCDNGVALLDDSRNIVFWNDWMVSASNIAGGDALGQNLSQLFPEAQLRRVDRAIAAALEDRQASVLSRALNPTLFPLFHRTAKGKRGGAIEHQAVIKPLDTVAGRYCLLQIFDVSDAVHRERYLKDQAATLSRLADELTASEQRLRRLLEASPTGVAIIANDGIIQFANRRLAELFLATTGAVAGRHLADFFIEPTDLVERARQGVERLEVRFRRNDGSNLWAQVTGEEIRYEDATAVLCWVYDISEQKEAELLLTGERDRAQHIAQTKTDFLAMVSHEIRTPLNGILGMAHMLGDTGLEARQREFVDTIQYSGEALLTILNEVLDLSKFEAGGLKLEESDVDIRRLVDSMMMLMSARAGEKDLDLSARINDDVHEVVVGDAGRLRQVLLNLIGNAIKFTEQGSVVVSVEQLGQTDDDVTLMFSVTDSGIGVPEDVRSKLFTEFYQVDPSISRRFGGTGLGLAICRRIVEAMDGTIGVDSTPGDGSHFWFQVTLEKGDPDRASSPRAVRATVADVPRLKVLLVEDNEINQKVALGMLARDNHDVSVVADGQGAIDHVRRETFDLVLMDIQLPGMDGLEATRRIRALDDIEKANTPIVALTANAMPEDVQTCLAAGMNDVLAKPIDPGRLNKAILDVADLPVPTAGGRRPAAVVDGIDWSTIDGLTETIGSDKLVELFDLFDTSWRETLDEMTGAIDSGDRDGLKQLAHRLKGSALNLGLHGISDATVAIENGIRQEAPLEGFAPMVSELETLCRETQSALNKVRPVIS
ncbi:MAG: ATP-binding protein [Pseudomonadota bacterium]